MKEAPNFPAVFKNFDQKVIKNQVFFQLKVKFFSLLAFSSTFKRVIYSNHTVFATQGLFLKNCSKIQT